MPIYCGFDFHARQQVVAWCDTSDGEIRITKLDHSDLEKVRQFYSAFSGQVIVGLEASGYSQWFEDLLFELKHEVRIGNASEIRKRARSRQKNDRRDAENILDLLLKNEFPQIYRPNAESRAVLQKLRHRHRLVQLRTKAINHLHAIAIGAGLSIKSKLMTNEGRKKLKALLLNQTHQQQRDEWLALVDHLTPLIEGIERELKSLAQQNPHVTRLMTQVAIPNAAIDLIEQLRRDLVGKGIIISDRRWGQALGVLQAHALTEGRDAVTEDDLVFLKHVLWQSPEQQAEIGKALARTGNPLNSKTVDYEDQAASVHRECMDAQQAAQSEEQKMQSAIEANTKLKQIGVKLQELREQAAEQGRNTNRIDKVIEAVAKMKQEIASLVL